MENKEQLCWTCANCTDERKCPWVSGKPIKGWTAEKTIIHESKNESYFSYRITACPKYKQDSVFLPSQASIAKYFNISIKFFLKFREHYEQKYKEEMLNKNN